MEHGVAAWHLAAGNRRRRASHRFRLSARCSEVAFCCVRDDRLDLGRAGQEVANFRGETQLQSVYAQDTWRFAGAWRATLGMRLERWEASDGAIAGVPVPGGNREETFVSPKFALAHQVAEAWSLKASVGRAVRMPTVSELYQGTLGVGGNIVNNDPTLEPERSWTGELTAERALDSGSLRATLFHEDTRDALYSQVNTASGDTVSTVQNVDQIRTTGVEVAYQAQDVGIAGLDLVEQPDVCTLAHSRERQLSGECRQMAATRAGVARQPACHLSHWRKMDNDAGRPLQRHDSTTRSTTPIRMALLTRA